MIEYDGEILDVTSFKPEADDELMAKTLAHEVDVLIVRMTDLY